MVRALSWNAQGSEFEPQLKFDFVFYAILNFTLFIFMFGYFHIFVLLCLRLYVPVNNFFSYFGMA